MCKIGSKVFGSRGAIYIAVDDIDNRGCSHCDIDGHEGNLSTFECVRKFKCSNCVYKLFGYVQKNDLNLCVDKQEKI